MTGQQEERLLGLAVRLSFLTDQPLSLARPLPVALTFGFSSPRMAVQRGTATFQ
jgi:hypothetical protein